MQAQPGNSGRMPRAIAPSSLTSVLPVTPQGSQPTTQATPPAPRSLVPASPALGLLLSPRKMDAQALPDRSLRAHSHCARAQGAAPSAALSIVPLSPAPSRHLTYWRLRGVRSLLPTYPLRDSPDAEGFLSHRANATSRRARRAPERPAVCGAVGSATSGALRNQCACAPWAPARNATHREPMKRQRLSSPGQSAFGAESLTPI